MTDDPRKAIVESGYDALGERYAEWSARIEGDPRDAYIDDLSSRLPDGARVLDLGCGSGIPSAKRLAERFDVVGVDLSAAQVDRARSNVPGGTFIEGDLASLTFPPASFAAVVALYSISHVPRVEHAAVFANVFSWLVPGGVFVVTLGAGDSPDWIGEWLGVQMFFSGWGVDESRSLVLDAGFEIVQSEVVEIHEPEGPVAFLWMLARKPD